jgi:uncharacterized protein YigE (DUF2233 family)
MGKIRFEGWFSVRRNPILLPFLLLAFCFPRLGFASPFAGGVRGACTEQRFEGERFTICRFDAQTQDFRLIMDAADGWPLRHLPALAHDLGDAKARVRFAMNAGMYDRAGQPLGLYVENGKQRRGINTKGGSGNFFLQPAGVFSVTKAGMLQVDTLDAYRARKAEPRFATQSGPMLLIGGKLHPKIHPNGTSRHYRNGVGIVNGHSAWFVISETRVSLGTFARFFRDQLHCRDALYLDGAVSSLWYPGGNRMDSNFALGPLLVVSDRP